MERVAKTNLTACAKRWSGRAITLTRKVSQPDCKFQEMPADVQLEVAQQLTMS